MDAVRAARANMRYHLEYIGRLIGGPQLARGRSPHLCRSGGGGASVLRGLSGRRGVGRERERETLVRAAEVAPVVPSAARRAAGGHGAEPDLRRSRLLNGLQRARARTRLRRLPRSRRPRRRPRARASGSPRGWRQGRHGEMAWMAETFARRAEPRALWPEARSVVMLAMNYGPRRRPARGDPPARSRRHLRLRAPSRLSRRRQGPAQDAGRLAGRQRGENRPR